MHIVMVLLLVFICGCNTPYTGDLGPEDFNGWIESEDVNFVCLFNGFDRICIKTIRGHKGDQGIQGPAGKDGRDGIDGIDGVDGRDGIDGAVVYLLLEKIVTETVFVDVPVIQKEVFVLYVSRTDTTYITPLGEVYVPENAPVVATSGVTVTPTSIDNSGGGGVITDNYIWHVAYSVVISEVDGVESSKVEAFVYPRCFNNQYVEDPTNKVDCPPDTRDITNEEYFESNSGLENVIQGTKEFVKEQFKIVSNIAEKVNVEGIQGIVN